MENPQKARSQAIIARSLESKRLAEQWMTWQDKVPVKEGGELIKRIQELSAELNNVWDRYEEYQRTYHIREAQPLPKLMTHVATETDGTDTAVIQPPVRG